MTPTCTDDGTESNPGISERRAMVVPDRQPVGRQPAERRRRRCRDRNPERVDLRAELHGGPRSRRPVRERHEHQLLPRFQRRANGDGYNQLLSYDLRLSYLNPPHLLQATDTVWDIVGFVVCGTVNSDNFPVSSGGQSIS